MASILLASARGLALGSPVAAETVGAADWSGYCPDASLGKSDDRDDLPSGGAFNSEQTF